MNYMDRDVDALLCFTGRKAVPNRAVLDIIGRALFDDNGDALNGHECELMFQCAQGPGARTGRQHSE